MKEQSTHRGRRRKREYGRFGLDLDGRRLSFRTQPGVFSQYGPDEGTLLLLDVVLPHIKPHMKVLDLGAGVGIIGIAASTRATRGEIWMVDVDVRASRLAEENVRLNGIETAHVLLSDITLDLPDGLRFDLVLSNPPTHSGKEVLQSFVGESFDLLRPGGSLYLVVNRLLSVKEMMHDTFGNVEQMERRKGFIVFRAAKERQRRDADDGA